MEPVARIDSNSGGSMSLHLNGNRVHNFESWTHSGMTQGAE